MKQHSLQSGEVRPPIWGGLNSRFLASISLRFVPLHFSRPSLSDTGVLGIFFHLTRAKIELPRPNKTADIYISISTETFDIENIKYEKKLAIVRFRYIL